MTQERTPEKPRTGGARPAFFDDPAIDQIMAIVMAMSAEMSVLYDRVDTIERLLDTKGTLQRGDIEAFRPDAAAQSERAARRSAYIARIFRVIREAAGDMVPHDKMDAYRAVMDEVTSG